MLVKLKVETPTNLPAEYLELIDKLAEMEKKHPGEKVSEFGRMKNG